MISNMIAYIIIYVLFVNIYIMLIIIINIFVLLLFKERILERKRKNGDKI